MRDETRGQFGPGDAMAPLVFLDERKKKALLDDDRIVLFVFPSPWQLPRSLPQDGPTHRSAPRT